MAATFIKELRRRRVFRTAGLYLVGVWGLLQVADLAFDSWGVAAGTMRYLWMAAAVLFPLVLFFGWRYDIGASGIVRTVAHEGDVDLRLRRVDYAILAALLAIAAISSYVVLKNFGGTGETDFQDAADTGTAQLDPRAIAVLPFTTRSSQEDTVFFADGMHDDLLTTLSNVGALKVISRTSVLRFRDTTKSIREIAGELGVAHILEGAVQAAGESVRINVQLIDATADTHRWAETYDRQLSLENLFAIQSEIVETIARELTATISADQRRRINARPTADIEAYREQLLGKKALATATFDALEDAAGHFRRAIELDPGYVLPRAGLAETLLQQARTGAIAVDEALALGFEHIELAVARDPDDAYAQAVMAAYESAAQIAGAEQRFERAVALNPNSVDALRFYASFLVGRERPEDALGLLREALELDPLSVRLLHSLGSVYVGLGDFDAGRAAFMRISQINPGNPYAIHGAAQATIMSGQLIEAGYWSDAVIDKDDYENPAASAVVYGSAGDLEAAAKRVDAALALGPGAPYPLAAQVFYLTLSGAGAEALAVARGALVADLDDRWGSEQIFLRALRDEALRSGQYDEALAWYRRRLPEVLATPPAIDAGNIEKASDFAHLLQAAGDRSKAEVILEAVVERYEELYRRGAANFPLGPARAQALALLGRPGEALDELEQIIRDGWRLRWRYCTELNPSFASLEGLPRYEALLEDIREDLARQRSAFEASPLSKSSPR